MDVYVPKQGMVLAPIPVFRKGWCWGPRLFWKAEWPIFMLWDLEWDLSSRSYLGVFFSLLEKTGRDRLTGPFQMDHHPKASLSSAYFLSSLMRMVAMRRMLERILNIQVSNTSNGSSFNLVSTYNHSINILSTYAAYPGVRPGRRENSGTSVLVYPICGISTLNQDISL